MDRSRCGIAADALDLAQHRALVRGKDLLRVRLLAERCEDGEWCGQRDLKPDARGKATGVARHEEVFVRGSRLAPVTELPEMHIFRRDARCELQWYLTFADPNERRIRAQHRNLPADPQSSAVRLAVRDAFQVRSAVTSDRREHFFWRIERDAPDEMHIGHD